MRFEIVGVIRDARYQDMREPIAPTAYVPFHAIDAKGAPQPVREGLSSRARPDPTRSRWHPL
jgi:hypothetical protein